MLSAENVKGRDQVTIITSCSKQLAVTKTHEKRVNGEWKSNPYDRVLWWSAEEHVVSSFDDMVRLLMSLSKQQHSCFIRDRLREGVNAARCNRRISDFEPHPVGHHVLGLDIDDLAVCDVMGVEAITPTAEGLRAAVEAVEKHLLPAQLQGASVYFQWSASAGIKPWEQYRLHLWYWLDRPVCRGSLKEWAKTVDGLDESFFDSVRIHYTADPIIKNMHGSRMTDILDGLRCGVIRREVDTAKTPHLWLDLPTYERETARKRASLERQRALNSQAQRDALAVDPDSVKDAAVRRLHSIATSIVDGLPSVGRHQHVRAKIRAAFGLRELVDTLTIADVVRPYAETALERAGRSPKVAAGDTDRLIKDLINSPHKAPAFPLQVREVRQQIAKPRIKRKEVESLSGWIAPEVEVIPAEQPEGARWEAPAEGWQGEGDAISLLEGRAWLDAATIKALDEGARTALVCPAGSGKSYAAKRRALIELTSSGDDRAQLIVPTLKLAHEAVKDLREMAEALGHNDFHAIVAASRRGPDEDGHHATCHRFDEVVAASQASPEGAKEICRRCEYHPSNAGTGGIICPYYQATKSERVADVIVKTHVRFVLEGKDGNDNGKPWRMTVIDEDPSGALTSSVELGAWDLKKLVDDGDVVAPLSDVDTMIELLAESRTRIISASELRERLDIFSWVVSEAYNGGRAAVTAAASSSDEEERATTLESAVPWRAIAGFREALSDRWGEAQMRDGQLQVTHTMPLPVETSTSVIYLDATASEARARALLGKDATVKRLLVQWPEHARVSWIPVDAGKSSALHREGARRVPLIWSAAVARWGWGRDALVITSKRNRDEMLWTGEVLMHAEESGGAVLHHRGPGGRGLNQYKGRSSVLVDPWHVPLHTIRQTAYCWCKVAGDDWSVEADQERWIKEASAQLLGAEVLQEIARVRPLGATAERPVDIVILDKRDPRSLGLPLDDVVDPDALAWEALGAVTGWETAPSITASIVDRAGGCYMPLVDRASLSPMRVSDVSGQCLQPISLQRPITIIRTIATQRLQLDLTAGKLCANTLMSHAKNNGGWTELARSSRVGVVAVEVDGGKPQPLLYRGKVHRQTLERWLRSSGATRYRIKGERWVALDGIDSRIWNAMKLLMGRLVGHGCSVGVGDVIGAIMETTGRSEATARAVIKRYQIEGETLAQTAERLWAECLGDQLRVVVRRLSVDNNINYDEATQKVFEWCGERVAPWRRSQAWRE